MEEYIGYPVTNPQQIAQLDQRIPITSGGSLVYWLKKTGFIRPVFFVLNAIAEDAAAHSEAFLVVAVLVYPACISLQNEDLDLVDYE